LKVIPCRLEFQKGASAPQGRKGGRKKIKKRKGERSSMKECPFGKAPTGGSTKLKKSTEKKNKAVEPMRKAVTV